MLAPLFALGKPVVATEFGLGTYVGADKAGGAMNLGNMVDSALGLHSLPLVGRFVRPRLNGVYVRDEELQARELSETLAILDSAGVDGAFVSTFFSAIHPYDEDPRYDLDMAASTLVKTLTRGRHGTTYPDLHALGAEGVLPGGRGLLLAPQLARLVSASAPLGPPMSAT
jgi:hypothetical protein